MSIPMKITLYHTSIVAEHSYQWDIKIGSVIHFSEQMNDNECHLTSLGGSIGNCS